VVFTPVDHPNVEGATVAKLIESGALIAIPQYLGRHGHPVLFSRSLIPEFLALPPDSQARAVTQRHANEIRTLMSRTAEFWTISTIRSISPAAASTMKTPDSAGPEMVGGRVCAGGSRGNRRAFPRCRPLCRTDPHQLETALGRRVEFGMCASICSPVPDFPSASCDQERPGVRREPFAYVESLDARPALWALIMGRLEFASLRSRTPD